jgi:hypothetical protein
MNTTAQMRPLGTPSGAKQSTDPRRSAHAPASERPTFGGLLAELVPLIGFVPQAGPPVVFVLGPWLFLVLMLAAPFACLFALVVVMIVAAAVLAALTAAILAILAAPYLLARHLRRHRARHASVGAPGAQVVGIESRRVAA